jgi:alanyl-tRNA synthetase
LALVLGAAAKLCGGGGGGKPGFAQAGGRDATVGLMHVQTRVETAWLQRSKLD